MKRQNIRTLSLIVCTFTYLLVGAAIFDALESEHEISQKNALRQIEAMIKRKYNMSDEDFRILTTIVIKSVPHKAGVQWKFEGAFYFATTVLTTIGYGHSTPATFAGKMFCMFYALAGIPLGLVMFQSIGERLNTFVAFSLKFCKKLLKMKTVEVTETNLIIFVGLSSCLVMTTGAVVFAHFEKWSLFDSLYFSFITLTTIGFGDYVALQKDYALQSKPEYVVFSLVFILFGLSVVSAAINLLVLRFLTLNTEDERRDEAEAALTAAGRVRLEGDVITGNDSVISSEDRDGGLPADSEFQDTASVCSCTCYGNPRRRSFLTAVVSSSKSDSGRRKALLRRESSSLMMMAVTESGSTSSRSKGTIFVPSNTRVYARKASTFSTASAAPAYYRHYQDDDEDQGQVLAIQEEDLPSGSFDLDGFSEPPDPRSRREAVDCNFHEENEFAHPFNYTNTSFNYSNEASESYNNFRERQPGSQIRSVGRASGGSRQQVSHDPQASNQSRHQHSTNGIDRNRSVTGWRRYTPSAILRSMSGRQSSPASSREAASSTRDRHLITFTDASSYDVTRSQDAMPHSRRRLKNSNQSRTAKGSAEKTHMLITLQEDADAGEEESRLKRASI